MAVDPAYTPDWFEAYLDTFAACGRGESDDLRPLLHYYGVPLLLTSDEAAVAFTTQEEVLSAVRRQIDAMRAAGYRRSETLSSNVVALNATSALHTAEFSRQRADGSQIGGLRATYLITVGPNGCRISALAVHARDAPGGTDIVAPTRKPHKLAMYGKRVAVPDRIRDLVRQRVTRSRLVHVRR
jgi:hypothetical protein